MLWISNIRSYWVHTGVHRRRFAQRVYLRAGGSAQGQVVLGGFITEPHAGHLWDVHHKLILYPLDKSPMN